MSLNPASDSRMPIAGPREIGLSVVVCCFTSQRRTQLLDAVASAERQVRPGDQVIVVVDHNAILHTELRRALSDRVTLTTNTFQQGLSGARNSGLALARNDVVVFLDDDAALQTDALDAVRSAFADESVVSIGGAVDARWAVGAPPHWFPAEFGWVIGCDYRGLPDHGAPIRNPIGAAMAVRRDALNRIDGFSSRLGRVGNLPTGCEETLMGVQLNREFPDRRIIRHTGFRVSHHVPADRATVRYFARRCYQEGRSKAALARISGQQAALSSERSYTTRILTSGLWRALRTPLRAVALVGGFAVTSTGFAVGLIQATLIAKAADSSREELLR